MKQFVPTISLALVLLAAADARADWPVFGHDVQRTARSVAPASIVKPVTRWRHYIGGAVGARGLRAADVDADGKLDILVVSGGRVIARHDDDSLVWDSPLIDAGSLVDILDIDGDGQLDIIVRGNRRVLILAGKTGAVEWDSSSWNGVGYNLGAVGAIRLADLDGDGKEDLYAAANYCGSGGTVDVTAVALSFRGQGNLMKPKKLFETSITGRDYACGGRDLLLDVDGDKQLDVVAFGLARIYVYSTVDGSLKFTSAPLGNFPYGQVTVDAADLDADGKKDLVIFTNNNYAPNINSRRVLVVGWTKDMAGNATFAKWWEKGVTDQSVDRHGFADTSLRDVDGDGTLDVTTSFYSGANNRWTLKVYDAKTGTEKASLDDTGPLVGLVDLDGQGSIGILTEPPDGVTVYTVGGGLLNKLKTYSNTTAISVPDYAVERTMNNPARPLTAQACGTARPELILFEKDADTRPATVAAYQTALNVPKVRCTNAYDIRPDDETFIGAFSLSGGLLLGGARSSGYLTTLAYKDGVLPNNLGTGEFAGKGLRLGGYYSGTHWRGTIPIAPAVAGIPASPVIVNDSRGFLVAFDVSKASLVTAPVVRWVVPNVSSPAAFDVTGSATVEVLGWRRNAVVALDVNNGQELLKLQVAPPTSTTRFPNSEPLAADVNGDGKRDIVYQIYNTGSGNVETNALNAATGQPIWSADHQSVSAGCIAISPTLVDLDGDGALDIVQQNCSTVIGVDGKTGTLLAGRSVNGYYSPHALAWDVDGDGAVDIVGSAGVTAPRAWKRDFTQLWTNTDIPAPNFTYHMAAVAECSNKTVRWAGTGGIDPVLYILDAANGKTQNGVNNSIGVVLAEGQVFPSVAAAQAMGKRPGILGNVISAQHLRGANTPSFVVGSSDGWLYAVDACGGGGLVWALNLRSPVGQPILADVRGTGSDELIVSVADGYLYGIDQEVFPAPAAVRDVDPPGGKPTTQVDTIATVDTLYVNWDLVPGATKYECAVLTATGTIITKPDFVDCGAGPSATLTKLDLKPGLMYRQAVRAVGPTATSAETVSKGVTVIMPAMDMAPPADLSSGQDAGADLAVAPDLSTPIGPQPGGCSCTVGGESSSTPAALALAAFALIAFALLRRRR